jgi:hypothetical protein
LARKKRRHTPVQGVSGKKCSKRFVLFSVSVVADFCKPIGLRPADAGHKKRHKRTLAPDGPDGVSACAQAQTSVRWSRAKLAKAFCAIFAQNVFTYQFY